MTTPEELEQLWADPSHWHLGIYSCKADPRIWVPKRPRWAGWTLNFAHRRSIWLLIALLLICLGVYTIVQFTHGSAHAAEPDAQSTRYPAVPDATWDAAFTRTDGWNGGDAAYSVDLHDGRTLWLFADSWVGPVKDNHRVAGNKMINNAIAVHPTPKRGEAPRPADVEFITGPLDEKNQPTSWIKPNLPGEWTGKHYYWPADAIAPASGDRLILTLWHVATVSGGPFGFKTVGGAIAIVDNPHDHPRKWNIKQFNNPHVRLADKEHGKHDIQWGAAVLASPDDPAILYIYGIREDGWNKQLLLGKAPAAHIEDFTTWRFKTADGWSEQPDKAATICDGVVNELRVQRIADNRWAMVHSEPMLGTHVMVRTAAAPEGPWSKPTPVFNVTLERQGNFTYAAKSHPTLAGDGELLITYVINGGSFWDVLGHADLYRPRFLRVPITALK
jgi:hypothetical protein